MLILGLPPPYILIIDYRSVFIMIYEPEKSNGIITKYEIFHAEADSEEFVLLVELENFHSDHVHPNLLANSRHQYKVTAYNAAGPVTSPIADVVLPHTSPVPMKVPILEALSSTTLNISWEPPSITNGDLDQYRVLLNTGTPQSLDIGVSADFTNTIVPNLTPYTKYSVRLSACLVDIPNGCSMSPSSSVTTLSAAPQFLDPPTLEAVASDSVKTTWNPPTLPNGVILKYSIYRRLESSSSVVGLLINRVGGSVRSYINTGPELSPYTLYDYRVQAQNTEGMTNSEWASVRTLEAHPQGIEAPSVENSDAYSIELGLTQPSSPNGVIIKYNLDYRETMVDPTLTHPTQTIVLPVTTSNRVIVSGLQPYSSYDIRLVVFNSIGKFG